MHEYKGGLPCLNFFHHGLQYLPAISRLIGILLWTHAPLLYPDHETTDAWNLWNLWNLRDMEKGMNQPSGQLPQRYRRAELPGYQRLFG